MSSTPRPSFHELCARQLDELWRAIHGVSAPSIVKGIASLLVPPAMARSSWPSYVSDDHTPYELSLLLGHGTAEIRLMAEPLPAGGARCLGDTVTEARRLRTIMEKDFGVGFERFDRIADLFLPEEPTGAFAIWYAASFAADGTPSFKVYLNPAIRGRDAAPQLVEQALDRLGLASAFATVTRAFRRGPELDELRFFSIDLGKSREARVKVYGFHHEASIDELAHVMTVVPQSDIAAVRRFCRALLGSDGELRASRQPATCLAFVGTGPLPATGTVHVPIRSFAGDDRIAHARVCDALREIGIDASPFDKATSAIARRPLESGGGLIAWSAIRTGFGGLKSNVYLAPKAMFDEPTHPEIVPVPRVDDVEAVVKRFEQSSVAKHPFLARLAREPFNGPSLALLVLNVREAITLHFARRLASIVARVEEDDLRSVLAKQLNDELGSGDPNRTHKTLFEKFAAGITPWAPQVAKPELLEPGRRFGEVQEELYLHRSPYEGLGATLIMEVLGKQGDLVLGTQLRRAKEPLSAEVMEWLVLHEELEFDHVDESLELARRVPPGNKARLAVRGAEELRRAGWAFLDDMYRACFSDA